MRIDSLVIEVTRRCNIACEHCLRGDAQAKDMPEKYINELLQQVDEISTVTFSGGEPSLVPEVLGYFLKYAKQYDVDVANFYIATNGKKISEDFFLRVAELYIFCDENDVSEVKISNTQFHQCEHYYEGSLLDVLSFARKEKPHGSFISEGRYIDIDPTQRTPECGLGLVGDTIEGNIYLNVLGEIIDGCDWSYESQKEHKICDVIGDIYEQCLQVTMENRLE